MASSCREVCRAVQDFLKTVPSDQIKAPVDLVETISKHIEKYVSKGGTFKIQPDSKAWGHRSLKGMFCRYVDGAHIYYSNTLNPCWKRFVFCKEMSHLLIDSETKHFTYDPVELVQQLIAGAPSLTQDDKVRSEKLAVFAAIEILLPWQLRPEIERSLLSGDSDIKIAHKFKVPEHVVTYLVRTKYWEVSNKCHTDS